MRDEPRVRATALSLDEVVDAVRRADAGGLATFLGVVRDHSDGRPVTLLEYEAYGAMAESEIRRIERLIEEELPHVRVRAVHRTGALLVGDTAVVCAASAPHRGDAFRACMLLIDRIKATVPIWKREHGPDGPYWVGWRDARCAAEHDADEHKHE